MASTAMTAMRVEVSDDRADRRREQAAGQEGQRPGTDRVSARSPTSTRWRAVPMWMTVQTKAGIGHGPRVFVPLARLKEENGELRDPTARHTSSNRPRSMLRTASPRTATMRFAPTTASALLIRSCGATTRDTPRSRPMRRGRRPALRTSICLCLLLAQRSLAQRRLVQRLQRLAATSRRDLHQPGSGKAGGHHQ